MLSSFNFWLISLFITLIVGFISGYAFCYFRYRIYDLLKLVDLLGDVIADKISPEEALKKLKELD